MMTVMMAADLIPVAAPIAVPPAVLQVLDLRILIHSERLLISPLR
jgi:hypothetical protein